MAVLCVIRALRPGKEETGMEDKLRVGVICATHGLRGEVKVFPTTDEPERFRKIREVILVGKSGELPLEIAGVRFFKKYVMLRFKGRDRIEDVEPFVKSELYVTRENAVPLGEDEYYIADLIGMQVYDEDGNGLGTLKEVLQTGANDVYVVDGEQGERLIPAIHQCILKVEVDEGRMTVHLLEGL